MRQKTPGTFHLGSFEGVFRTLGNKDASGEFPRLSPQETAGVGGNGAGGAGKICDFRSPKCGILNKISHFRAPREVGILSVVEIFGSFFEASVELLGSILKRF